MKQQETQHKRPRYKACSKQQLRETQERCREIFDTITIRELQMLWYLRHARYGDTYLFFRAAKMNYEAARALQRLIPSTENETNDPAPDEGAGPSEA